MALNDLNTQTGPITIHCAAKLSAQCNNVIAGHLDLESIKQDLM